MTETLLGLAVIMVLSLSRVPIALSMGVVGFGFMWYTRGITPAVGSLTAVIYDAGFNYNLSVLPLFILMGNLVTRSGLSREIFATAQSFMGHWRGGLGMATIAGCAGFGAICGSSIATAATFTKVAYPSMKQQGYADSLATGAISSGGTLGILIPPSTIMILYGLMTETNIGQLFAAGVIPGLLMTVLLCGGVWYTVWRDPSTAPLAPPIPWAQRWKSLKGVWGVIVLFGIVMGGIYGGVFTATEGAAVGAFGAFLFALLRRSLNWSSLAEVLAESTTTTAMLFTIYIGAQVFGSYVGFTSMANDLKGLVSHYELSKTTVLLFICLLYILLGTVMEELSMILLTVPVLFPLVQYLGINPVWFGILIVVVVQIGMISPPVGMNMFVVKSLLPQVSTQSIFRGVIPFVVAESICLLFLILFPQLSLWLPQILKLA